MVRMKKTLSAAVVIMMAAITQANAQLAIEKALVAKSKLHNQLWTQYDPNSALEIDHSSWDEFLSKYVRQDNLGINLLGYSRVTRADKQLLADYLDTLQATDVTKLNRNEQYAFWLNLYNASIVKVGLDNYPVKSILDVKKNVLDLKGPFNDKVATVMGLELTPDDIESGIVRPIWNDPLLHYGFNCAAISCPNLGVKAFRGETLNEQLSSAAAAFINDPRGVTVKGGRITVSKIYFWYDVDFGGTDASILEHISRYAGPELKAAIDGKRKITRYEYDWLLNDDL